MNWKQLCVAAAVFASGCQQPIDSQTEWSTSLMGTAPDHIVVVIEENHGYSEIIGSSAAPYMNQLAASGALFTNSHAIEHPSEPNYLDFFSGSNQGVTNDSCPHTFAGANLGSQLIAAGRTFAGYSEDLPGVGSTVCQSGQYWRKHNPWVNFSNLPSTTNQPLTALPSDFTKLPTVGFVIPNQDHDMHDGTIAQADQWLHDHLDAYVQWAQTHNSLLIVTWDEDDSSQGNQIATFFVGPMVKKMTTGESINHFTVLRTIEDIYGLSPIGGANNVSPITDVWQASGPPPDLAGSTPDLATPGDGGTGNLQRTVVFMYQVTAPGQNLFIRGGIDYGYASRSLGRDCNANPRDCQIPIHHRNLKNPSTASLKAGDNFLDWLGPEPMQDPSTAGSPLDWTIDHWPPAWGPTRTVAQDGFGEEPLNSWGPHYWMLDVDMDCSKTANGWFELKAFRSWAGWEPAINQSGTPYPSTNHMARCGQVNRFTLGSSSADIHPF